MAPGDLLRFVREQLEQARRAGRDPCFSCQQATIRGEPWRAARLLQRSTKASKRAAALRCLFDPAWIQRSDREIARRCGVSHELVRQLRKSICQQITVSRIVSRNGKTYLQKQRRSLKKKANDVRSSDGGLENRTVTIRDG